LSEADLQVVPCTSLCYSKLTTRSNVNESFVTAESALDQPSVTIRLPANLCAHRYAEEQKTLAMWTAPLLKVILYSINPPSNSAHLML